eukprot:1144446-Pelagomonas_calceolata.AAC.11
MAQRAVSLPHQRIRGKLVWVRCVSECSPRARKEKLRRQRKLSLHQIRKRRRIGSEPMRLLSQKSRESPPPPRWKKIVVGIWKVIGGTRPQNMAARSIAVINPH